MARSFSRAALAYIDCNELTDFANKLGKIPKEKEKQRKQFMRKQGSALRRATVKEANSIVKKTAVSRRSYRRVAGAYHKSIKRGRWYEYGAADCIRVYSSDKIGHLVERGWTPVLRNKRRGPSVEGKDVFSSAAQSFEPKFYMACDTFASGYKGDIEK